VRRATREQTTNALGRRAPRLLVGVIDGLCARAERSAAEVVRARDQYDASRQRPKAS
jgi:hypothetical protein